MLRVFFGHHKCGSRFFRNDLLTPAAASLNWQTVSYVVEAAPFRFRRLDELDLLIDFAALSDYSAPLLLLSNASKRVAKRVFAAHPQLRGLRVIRDPRQVLVSNYYHHLDGHDTQHNGWLWEKLIEDRAILRRLPLQEGLRYELDNISRELIETQLLNDMPTDAVLSIRLEDYHADPEQWNRRIETHLQMPQGVLDAPANRYRNVSGAAWRDVFDEHLVQLFKRRYGADLIRLGYEEDLAW